MCLDPAVAIDQRTDGERKQRHGDESPLGDGADGWTGHVKIVACGRRSLFGRRLGVVVLVSVLLRDDDGRFIIQNLIWETRKLGRN